MIFGFFGFHEFFYEFQAISTATPFQLVCFGGHFIMQLITPSPFTSSWIGSASVDLLNRPCLVRSSSALCLNFLVSALNLLLEYNF
jgi:hypothetical protein